MCNNRFFLLSLSLIPGWNPYLCYWCTLFTAWHYLTTRRWSAGQSPTIFRFCRRTRSQRSKVHLSVTNLCKRTGSLTQDQTPPPIRLEVGSKCFLQIIKFILKENVVKHPIKPISISLIIIAIDALIAVESAQDPQQQQQQEQVQTQKQPEYYKAKEHDPNEPSPLERPPPDASQWVMFTWRLVYPIHYMCRKTMPDCRQEQYRNWYPFTFCISMIWISFYSYFMVWMITIIGKRKTQFCAFMRNLFLSILPFSRVISEKL